MQKHFILKLLFLLICINTICNAQNIKSDEQQIRANRNKSNKAIAEKDTLALALIWANDYHMVSSRNFEISGAEKNRHNFANEFNTKKEVLYVRTPVKIEVNTNWNMAAETGEWKGQWREPDGMVKLSGSYYAKWHKINGEWKIRAEIFTPLTCTGSKFCDQQPKIK